MVWRLTMGRKGAYTLGHKFVYVIVFVVFVALIFSYTNNWFVKYRIKTVDNSLNTEAQILAERFVGDPDCFAYYDQELRRSYPGVIDTNKLKSENVEECLEYLPKGYRVEVSLRDKGDFFVKESTGKKIFIDFHKGKKQTIVWRDVLVRTNKELVPDILILGVNYE